MNEREKNDGRKPRSSVEMVELQLITLLRNHFMTLDFDVDANSCVKCEMSGFELRNLEIEILLTFQSTEMFLTSYWRNTVNFHVSGKTAVDVQ